MIGGSEVPNLLQPNAESTLVVSQDVDIGVAVDRVESIKRLLRTVTGLAPSSEEPSVYVPSESDLIEANFLGLDSRIREPGETYVFEDPDLPLMVFGPLGLLRPGRIVDVDGLRLPLPRVGDLMVEKLLTDRTGEKGVRDLLVVAGLFTIATEADLEDVGEVVRRLSAESRHEIRSALTVLSLLDGRANMPDPKPVRAQAQALIARLEQ